MAKHFRLSPRSSSRFPMGSAGRRRDALGNDRAALPRHLDRCRTSLPVKRSCKTVNGRLALVVKFDDHSARLSRLGGEEFEGRECALLLLCTRLERVTVGAGQVVTVELDLVFLLSGFVSKEGCRYRGEG